MPRFPHCNHCNTRHDVDWRTKRYVCTARQAQHAQRRQPRTPTEADVWALADWMVAVGFRAPPPALPNLFTLTPHCRG